MKLSICNTLNCEVNLFTHEKCMVIHVQLQESLLRNCMKVSICLSGSQLVTALLVLLFSAAL